jgi:hypothetical protein
LTVDARIRRADDLLAGQLAADALTAVDAGVDGADAEGDKNDAGDEAAVLEELVHHCLLAAGVGSR